jgi:pyridoxamine 5'-phosphate oxidase-like protein
MSNTYAEITPEISTWIAAQHLFFVATAPLSQDGHVNCSPKGLETFRVLSPTSVAYLDLTGSGAETIAHLRQNGRITIMFCSFDRTPKIVRIYGMGRAVLPADPDWARLAAHFSADPGSGTGTDRGSQRAIVVVRIDRIADSCGYAVPVMKLSSERDLLNRWSERRSAEDLAEYRVKHNTSSIDGLPALG